MKTLYKILMTVCILSTTSACSNDLDEKVYSKVTEQSYNYTTNDFYPVVASGYRYLRDLLSHTNYYMAQETSADAIVMPPNASGWDDGGIYRRMHYQTWNSEQGHVKNMWNSFYRGALICNNAINQIQTDKVPAPSPAEKETGIAELRATRAFYYWLICDNFGDAPLVTEPSNELPAKTPRKDIYDFLVKELIEVIPLLSEQQGSTFYGRMNRWAAKALLANIYLNAEVYAGQAMWNECISQCDDIINSGKFILSDNYNASFRQTGTESSREIMFTIPFDGNLAGGNNIHMFSWHGELKKRFETDDIPWGCGSAMGVTQFINTYQPNDTRLQDTWIMGPQFAADGSPIICTYDKQGQQLNYVKEIPNGNYTSESEGYRMFKFEIRKGEKYSSNTDFPLLRYSQVLMMKAECLLRTGRAGAGELVTSVRQRAFKANPTDAVVTDDQLKQNSSYQYGYVDNYKIVDPGNTDAVQYGRMYDELGWEFAWEGFRRRDMIRFGLYTKKSWLSHKPQGDYRTVFPIPESVLTSNPNLEQNPAYIN